MTDHAAEASKYQVLAAQAASALSDAWIAQMRDLVSTSQALATCQSAPQGLRDLAVRLSNTLEVSVGAASAITQRAKAEKAVLARKDQGKSAFPPEVRRILSVPK